MRIDVSLRLVLAALVITSSTGVRAQSRGAAPQPADLVLRGGKIVTVDGGRPVVEALAVSGDTIVAVGPNQEIQAYVGPNTKVIDLKGALATPGFGGA